MNHSGIQLLVNLMAKEYYWQLIRYFFDSFSNLFFPCRPERVLNDVKLIANDYFIFFIK